MSSSDIDQQATSGLSLAYIRTDSSTTQRDEKEHRSSRFRLGGKKEAAGVCRGRGPYKYIYMEFQWAFSCQVPSRNTAGNAFSCRKLRMALKRPETACPGTENVGDFDGRPGHGCRYRHMTRTLHQPITCAKAKTAATAAPAASFLSPNRQLHEKESEKRRSPRARASHRKNLLHADSLVPIRLVPSTRNHASGRFSVALLFRIIEISRCR